MKRVLFLLGFLGLVLVTPQTFAGNDNPAVKTVSGKVMNQNGEAVVGAEIKIVETGEVVFAGFDGEFVLKLEINKNQSIQINTLGFKPLTLSSNTLGRFAEVSLDQL